MIPYYTSRSIVRLMNTAGLHATLIDSNDSTITDKYDRIIYGSVKCSVGERGKLIKMTVRFKDTQGHKIKEVVFFDHLCKEVAFTIPLKTKVLKQPDLKVIFTFDLEAFLN